VHDLLPGSRILLGGEASEEAVKAADSPRILHIATHGFFLPANADSEEDPMLRSGLLLANADLTLAGHAPEQREDGVLTAYEASTLALEGTELVVLSACETGLGDTASGEGIFGLRRAMQVAGAHAVLSALWSVPDRETAELMTLFYQGLGHGSDAREALHESQTVMRARVKERYGKDLPFYWGAFVLVE
jgi:CHAT domain-containing protein